MKTIAFLEDLLANPHKILAVIKDDLQQLKEEYWRRAPHRILVDVKEELHEEDLVKDEEVLISITERGYIKRVPSKTYRTQGRVGAALPA